MAWPRFTMIDHGSASGSRFACAASVLVALVSLHGCCVCRCPPAKQPGAPCREPEKQTPSLQLPVNLGPAERAGPPSFEAFLETYDATRGFSELQSALRPYLGARIRWRLRSWGGEVRTRGGYLTPSGQQPEKIADAEVGRIRLISDRLPRGANLSVVGDARQPVVTCLALFSHQEGDRFVRGDSRRAPTPGFDEVVTIEATIWGVLAEGEGGNIWLHDCTVLDTSVPSPP